LPVVPYGYETSSVTIKEDHRQSMFKDGCLGKQFDIRGRKQQGAGEN
jgi:hypothetical protein